MNSSSSYFSADFKKLITEPEDVIVEMLNDRNFGFEKFLACSDFQVQEIDIALQVIAKACKSKNVARVNRVLGMIDKYESTFLTDHIPRILGQVYSGDHSVKLPRLVECYVNVLYTMVNNKISSASIAQKVIPNLQNLVNHLEFSKVKIDHVKQATIALEQKCIEFDPDSVSSTQPDNFRDISIFPKSHDIFLRSAPYLRPNVVRGPYKSVDDYLDVHFRLVREDMLCAFRDTIENYKSNPSQHNSNVYKNLTISFPPSYTVDGVLHKINLQLTKPVDWGKTKMLLPGSLVCLSSDFFKSSVLFATIKERTPEFGHNTHCTLEVTVEEPESDMEVILEKKYCMFETSGYFESSRHVLDALKSLNEENFPLADCIVYLQFHDMIPKYLAGEECIYCLHEKCVHLLSPCGSRNDACDYECHKFSVLNFSDWPTGAELKLDPFQYSAFQHALTQKLAIIQGPPGTGKTFLGVKIVKALLENDPQVPIIICCVTNHALDQFLERLLKCTKKIVRVGSQGSLGALLPHRLAHLLQAIRRMRTEGKDALKGNPSDAMLNESAEIVEMLAPDLVEANPVAIRDNEFYNLLDVSKLINDLIKLHTLCWKYYFDSTALNSILSKDFKQELCKEHNISDRLVTNMLQWLGITDKEKCHDICSKKWQSMEAQIKRASVEDLELKCKKGMWAISQDRRYILFHYWREKFLEELLERLRAKKKLYQNLLKKRSKHLNYDSNVLLKNADIIGVTMTGAAKNYELLHLCKPSIMIVEEAAEAFESHLISSLPCTIKHLILIGDHKQLRPISTTHVLSEKFLMNISLFERLFENNAPSSSLITQHRMRPCIADLLVPTIYPQLESHSDMYKYEHITGTCKDVFFINHKNPESQNSTDTSIFNEFEASFIIYLAQYFLNQGYNASQITVLGMYNAQIHLIQKLAAEGSTKDILITTVDNYQGEENDIILISFVRNNDLDIIGFLKESNRVCVALSRARKGLYCIGNFSMYSRKSNLFSDIYEKLDVQEMIGEGFPLQCPSHKRIIYEREISEIESFFQSGCHSICDSLLRCGHKCQMMCHFSDSEHKEYKCLEPCEKTVINPSNSSISICKRLCYQPCQTKKKKVVLPCGHRIKVNWNEDISADSFECRQEISKLLSCNHLVNVLCSERPENYMCKALIPITLNCGHKTQIRCGSKNSCSGIQCKEIELFSAPCGHSVEVPCSVVPDDDFLSHCKKACDSLLDCGHACVGLCSECVALGIHSVCVYQCELVLVCGHPCQGICGVPCPPCNRECFVSCSHTKCLNPCPKLCIECVEPCRRSCRHQSCTFPCYKMCEVPPCEEPCLQELDCGHQCIGLCGDPCPYICRVCNGDMLTSCDSSIDYFVQLLDCDHVVEVKQLTQYIEDSVEAFTWPCCPQCGDKITWNPRFSEQLKKCKQRVVDYCDVQEEKQKVEYLFRTAFGENNVAPWRFEYVKRKIQHILDYYVLSESTLSILNVIVINLTKLVNMEKYVLSNPRLESKLEALIKWMYCHLDKASFQQFRELECAVVHLEKQLDSS